MKPVWLWSIVLTCGWVGACGSDSPTTPSTTTTTVTATLGITPSTASLVVGHTQAFAPLNAAAAAVLTWTSSDPGILAIDSGGTATAIARGTATITVASDDGQSATLQIQVVPDYQGSWVGKTTVTACTDIGGFASNNYCSQRIRTAQPLLLNLTQDNLAISGTVYLTDAGGQVAGTVAGAIAAASGDIATLVGPLTGVVNGSNVTLTPISWNSLATDTGMTGNWAANVASPQVVGIATLQWNFSGVVRNAATSLKDARSTGIVPFFRHR